MADDFLTTYAPLANDIATATKLDPSVVLGIIDTETGHGQHVLGNNIFGISPGGRVAQYPDVQTGSQAFVSLMQTPRYASVAAAPDPASQAAALVKSGYNTVNPKYAATVAANAQNAAKVLGYEDNAPATEKDKALADPALQTTQQPEATTTPSASTDKAPSEKDKALADPALQVTTKPPPDDFGTFSPEGVYVPPGAIPAKGAPVASLEDLRDRIQQGEINALKWMAPDKDAGPIERGLRYAAMTGTHLAAGIAQAPLNALVFAEQGGPGPGGLTYNPQTGAMNLTPEAMAAASLGANPLRFGGALKPQLGPWPAPEQFGPPTPEPFGPPSAPTPAFVPPNTSNVPLPPRAPPTDTRPAMIPPNTTVDPVTGEVTPVQQPPTGVPGPAPTAEPIPPVGVGAAPPLSPSDYQWASGMRDRLAEIQQENQEAGIPGSVGAAATPQQMAQLTPAQMKAYRAQAELGEILAPPEPGMDRSIYVHGSEPTRAEYMGDPAESQKESLYRERDPNTYGPRLKQNMQARVNSYEDEMGTQPQLQDLRDDKALAAEKDGAAYMRAAGPLDLTPRLNWLDQQLADPRIQESPSRMKVLGELRDALFDADGNLKTDPGSGWGAHDDLIDRLDKSNDRTAAERYSQKLLVQYKKIVDGVNNTASNGAFQTFLDNQTGFAQKINSMEQLQGFRGRLTNRAGDINGAALHKFVADLAARRARPGVDPAMGISDDTMHALINIDKDMKRATNIDLGKSRGSQTNLFGALAQATGIGLAHAGALAISHGNPAANLFLQGALGTAHKMTGNVLLRRAARRGLAPPDEGFDYNPLTPPSAPP